METMHQEAARLRRNELEVLAAEALDPETREQYERELQAAEAAYRESLDPDDQHAQKAAQAELQAADAAYREREKWPAGHCVIVSRHPAAIEFIRSECPWLFGYVEPYVPGEEYGCCVRCGMDGPAPGECALCSPRVIESATPADVAGKILLGNVPLHLAALAAEVRVIEFDGAPPRGAEYGIAEMRAAGARLASYVVAPAAELCDCPHCRLSVSRRPWAMCHHAA